MSRSEWTLHLELPVGSLRPTAAADPGAFQVWRALHRPLVERDANPYALCEIVEQDDHRLDLFLREDAVWSNGEHIRIDDICRGFERGFATQPGLSALCQADSLSIQQFSERVFSVQTQMPAFLMRQVLCDLRFTPCAGSEPLYSGAFQPAAEGVYTSIEDEDIALRFRVLTEAIDVEREFRASALSATSPTAFDFAHRARQEPDFRPCTPDIHAFLFINPARRPALAQAFWRQRFLDTLAAKSSPTDVVFREFDVLRTSSRRLKAAAQTLPSLEPRRLQIIYGDYWPNRAILTPVVEGLGELGVDEIAFKPVCQDQLSEEIARANFEAALVLGLGGFEPDISALMMFLRLAAMVCPADTVAKMRRIVSSWKDVGDETSTEVLRELVFCKLPVVPLFGFRSGYLADAELADVPLVQGYAYRVETLVNTRN